MGFIESIATPETAYLRAQVRGLDTELSDLERLGGQAIQESREEARKRKRELISTLGEYGGSSTDFYKMLGSVDAQAMATEADVSQGVMMEQANVQRMKRQLQQLVPIRAAQEWWQAGKDGAGAGLKVAGALTGNPALAMGGDILSGGDGGSAVGLAEDARIARYNARQQLATPDYGAALGAGRGGANALSPEELLAMTGGGF